MNWDSKFISSAVSQDQHWQSKFLLKYRGLKKAGKNTTLKNEMSGVNVLTLINNGRINFSKDEVEIINRFVRNGGGLFIVGKPIKELKNISPATSSSINRTFKSTSHSPNKANNLTHFLQLRKKI